MWLRPWWPRLTLLLCRIKIPRILWPRLTLLLCRIKSLRILPFLSSLRAVDMRVSSKLLTRLDPQSFGFLLFHVLFVLYFCPAHAREVPHFACSPAKLCLKKYRSYSPSNGSKPYIWWQRGRMPLTPGESATTPLPTKIDSWFFRSFRSRRSSFATRHDKTHPALQSARTFYTDISLGIPFYFYFRWWLSRRCIPDRSILKLWSSWSQVTLATLFSVSFRSSFCLSLSLCVLFC